MHEHEFGEEFSFKNYFVPFTTAKAVHWIIIIGLTVFFNGLFNSFVGDDLGQIVDNVSIHSIGNIASFFTGGTFYNGSSQNLIGIYYRPLYLTFFSSIYSIWGANAFFFHLFQLLFHITNAILLFFLFKSFYKKELSFILAIIFLVHPINSEAVLYIADAQDILFFFFGIVSLIILKKYHTPKALFISSLFLLFSLFSKETGLLFLFITVIYVFLFEKKRLISVISANILVFLIYFLLRLHAIGVESYPSSSPISRLPFSERLINIPSMVLFYLKTFFWPIKLASSYQWIYIRIDLIHFYISLIIDLLFLALIIVFGSIFYKRSKKIFRIYLFFSLWFLLGLAFHLQLFPLDQTVAERWFYFPSVGLFGMIGVIVIEYPRVFKNKIMLGILVLILIFLSTRTIIRTFDWRNEFTIASHDIKVSKEAYGLENELSYAYFQEGQYKEAELHAQNAVNIYPYRTDYLNLGAADYQLGNYSGAKAAFLNAIRMGDSYQAYDNLAFLGLSYGDPEETSTFIKNTALKKNPYDGNLWLCLAALDYNFGNKINAKNEIQQAYVYDQSSQIISTYNAIMNNKPVKIGLKK